MRLNSLSLYLHNLIVHMYIDQLIYVIMIYFFFLVCISQNDKFLIVDISITNEYWLTREAEVLPAPRRLRV